MQSCFLLLGSNQGKKSEVLSRARREISNNIGDIVRASSVYETEAWGFTSDHTFLNMVIQINTRLSANSVLEKILKIEQDLGRVRNSKGYTSRIIDIDVLFYGNEIVDQPGLQIPHPRLHERMFTLVPLKEIDPEKIHPKLQKTISELVSQCKDKLEVKKYIPKNEAVAE